MTARPALLPDYVTPADLAGHLGIAERALRELAQELGVYRKIGKAMFFLEGDVQTILEAAKPCPTKSTGAAKSGTTGAPLPGGDYAALAALRTKASPKGSRQKPKAGNGKVILMDRGRT